MASNSDRIGQLMTVAQYQASRAHLFPNEADVLNEIEHHGTDLRRYGSLFNVDDRLLIDPDGFDEVILSRPCPSHPTW